MTDAAAPAGYDEFNRAQELGAWAIVPDYHEIVCKLQAIDGGLRVKFSPVAKCWAVFHRSHPGCPHNAFPPGVHDILSHEYLVSTVKAELSPLGVWLGLDLRIVRKMEQLASRRNGGYDLPGELERAREKRERERKHASHEHIGEHGEELAFAIRKQFGLGSYKGGIFVPKDIPGE